MKVLYIAGSGRSGSTLLDRILGQLGGSSPRAAPLHVKTQEGSESFANPTVTSLRAPSGASALVVTRFLPLSGAAQGEAGELIYYREYGPKPTSSDPVIAAAGDIACEPEAGDRNGLPPAGHLGPARPLGTHGGARAWRHAV